MDKGIVTDNWFFYTCFSDDRWRELASLPQIKTKDDAQKVMSILKGEKVKTWVKAYENNPVKEMYGSGVIAKIINRICIHLFSHQKPYRHLNKRNSERQLDNERISYEPNENRIPEK